MLLLFIFCTVLVQLSSGQSCTSGYIAEGGSCVDLNECSSSSLIAYFPFDGSYAEQVSGTPATFADPNQGFQSSDSCNGEMYFSQIPSYTTWPQEIGRLNMNDFTMSFWMRAYSSTTKPYVLFANRNSCTHYPGYWNIVVDATSSTDYTLFFQQGNEFGSFSVNYPGRLNYWTKYHVTITRVFTASIPRTRTTLFINGVSAAYYDQTGSSAAPISYQDYPGLSLGYSPCTSTYQSAQYVAIDDARFYSGYVNPWHIYNTLCTSALSNNCGVNACVNTNGGYTCASSCAKGYILNSTVGCVDFNECASSSLSTKISFNLKGAGTGTLDTNYTDTITQVNPSSVTQIISSPHGFQFRCGSSIKASSSNSAYGAVTWNSAVGKIGNSDFTISFWMQQFQFTYPDAYMILSNRQACGGNPAMWNFIVATTLDGQFQVKFEEASPNGQVDTLVSQPLTFGDIANVAVTRVGKKITLYINGLPVHELTTNKKMEFADTGLAIGETPCPNQYRKAIALTMDEVRIWKTFVDPWTIYAAPCQDYLLSNNCGASQTCTNTPGGFTCA